MNAPYTTDEVIVFSILGNIAPGSDEFGAYCYKDTWNIIGTKLCILCMIFLNEGRLLKEINTIVITLIPYTKCPYNLGGSDPFHVVMSFIHALLSSYVIDSDTFTIHKLMKIRRGGGLYMGGILCTIL